MKITYLYEWLGKRETPTLFLVAARSNSNTGMYHLDIDNFSRQLEKISLIDLQNLSRRYLESTGNGAEQPTLEDLFIYAHISRSYDFKTVKRGSAEFKRVMRVFRQRDAARTSRLTPFSESSIDGVLAQLELPTYIDYRPADLPLVLRIPTNTLEKLTE